MAGETGSQTAPVNHILQSLFDRPAAFSFSQAVRILHRVYGGGRPLMDFVRDKVRIRPHLSLGFPPSDIVSLERLEPSRTQGGGRGPRFRLTVSMMGLYGASSPLPAFYTEELLREDAEDRTGLRDFFDVFNDGIYGLFLRAGWFRYRLLPAVLEQKDTALREIFYAPTGLASAEAWNLFRSHASASLAAPLSQFPRSAAGLQAFLQGIFGVPVEVEQCVERKTPIAEAQRCRLGREQSLGESTWLGSEVRDSTGAVTLHIGPLGRAELADLTPCGGNFSRLQKMVRFYCTEPVHCNLHLRLDTANREKAGTAPGSCVLGAAAYGRLGCDAWLALPETRTGDAFFPARDARRREPPAPGADGAQAAPALRENA